MESKARVMIVEDSSTIKYEVRTILKKIGVDAIEVSNELGMLMKVEEYGKIVDLIIMDITLQYENGFDLIKRIKSIDKYKNIPILVFTEHADMDSVLKAKELGVIGYLRKPLKLEEFTNRIKAVLGIEGK